MECPERHSRTLLAVNLGLLANVALAVIKTSVGVLGHSPALLADGINSTSDVVYSFVVRLFVGLAQRPADDEHPYGHRQLESIAALLIGAFIVTTAVAIFVESVDHAYELWAGLTGSPGAARLALGVALATIVLKLFLTWFTRRIGRETANPAVAAMASDHRNDVFAAVAVSIGIFLGRQGYPWVDPAAGAIVALLILRTGLEILRDSASDLMGAVPSSELRQRVESVVRALDGVRQVEEVHAHRFGPYLVLNIMIGVDGHLTVSQGDDIATAVEQALERDIEFVRRVHVHYHPVANGT